MNIKKLLSFEWLKTPYTISIKDAETLEEKRQFNYTPAKLIVIGFGIFMLIFLSTFFILGFTRGFGGSFGGTDAELANVLNELEDLENKFNANDKLEDNIKQVLGGNVKYFGDEEKTKIKELPKVAKNTKGDTSDVDYLASVDIKLRREFEKQKSNSFSASFAVNSDNISESSLKDMYLFSPIEGIISEKYSIRKEHYGVDIVAKKDAEIKVVADGTVIFSGWTDETGHVVAIQHNNNLISVYKHCSVLLKKEGNTVRAGEIIAIIGNSGKFTSGPHLHFELWYKGNPVNPEGFVSF